MDRNFNIKLAFLSFLVVSLLIVLSRWPVFRTSDEFLSQSPIDVTSTISGFDTTVSADMAVSTVTTTLTESNRTLQIIDFYDLLWCQHGLTRLQKENIIGDNIGKIITGRGEVVSVLASPDLLWLEVKHCDNTNTPDVRIIMKDDQMQNILSLNEGDYVTYLARLDEGSLSSGGIIIFNGEIIGKESVSNVETCSRDLTNSFKECNETTNFDCYQQAYERYNLCLQG